MFWLIFAIALWGMIHSLLASLGFKAFLRGLLGNGWMRFYRLFYNLFALVSFVPILYLMISLPDKTFYQVPQPWNYLLRAGQWISLILLFAAAWQTDLLAFMGLRQLFEEEKSDLVTKGFYRLVRHPLYTFGLLILWLSPSVSVNTFVVSVALTIYILIGIVFEERKLQREFGQNYVNYKSITPMLVPGLPRKVAPRDASARNLDGNK